ncbi:hypothetical protein FALCPG4_008998 [Fusarium falciforme]
MMMLGVVGDSEMCDLNLAGVSSEMGEAICEPFVTMPVDVSMAQMKRQVTLRALLLLPSNVVRFHTVKEERVAFGVFFSFVKMSQRVLITSVASQILFTGRYRP